MGDISNTKLLEEYLEDAQLQGLTPDSIKDYESNLRIYLTYLNKSALEVTKADLKRFLKYLLSERKVHPKTVSRYYSAMSSFYDTMLDDGRIDSNPILPFRKRYIASMVKKNGNNGSRRQLISIEEARTLINSILDPRDRAINVLLCKTGIRRGELVSIDLEDIDWKEQSIQLKPKAKRTNLLVFFDDEVATALKRWIQARETWSKHSEDAELALFINQRGERLKRSGIYDLVAKYARAVGLHNPDHPDLSKRFTPHCYRHFMTTYLRRNGMQREYIKELRGDSRHEAIDIYHHIDPKDLRDAYLSAIPRLRI